MGKKDKKTKQQERIAQAVAAALAANQAQGEETTPVQVQETTSQSLSVSGKSGRA